MLWEETDDGARVWHVYRAQAVGWWARGHAATRRADLLNGHALRGDGEVEREMKLVAADDDSEAML